MNPAHVIFDMEAIEGSYRVCAGKTSAAEDVAYYTRNMRMEEKLVDEVWSTLSTKLAGFYLPDNRVNHKLDLVTSLTSRLPTRSLEPPSCDQSPPTYDDVIRDLPPEYSALPPLAQRKSTAIFLASTTPQKSHKSSSSLLKDRMLDVRIDFENPTGVREHKKKKPAAGKKAAPAPSPPPPPPPPAGGADGGDDNANGDGGDGGAGDSGGAGGGDGGDGGGDDGWGDWNVSGKKDKKKKLEEEEEERKAKEEEERKAKEEEERKAKEEEERLAKEEEERQAAEASAAKDLSWAEDNGGGDDSWAAFTNVGKKKKGKVRPSSSNVQDGV